MTRPLLLLAPLLVALGAACGLGPKSPSPEAEEVEIVGGPCDGYTPDLCVRYAMIALEPMGGATEEPPWTQEERELTGTRLRDACHAGHGQACTLLVARNASEPFLIIPAGDTPQSLAKRSCELRFEPGCHFHAAFRLASPAERDAARQELADLCAGPWAEACHTLAEHLEASPDARDQALALGFYERGCQEGRGLNCLAVATRIAPQRPVEAEWMRQKACFHRVNAACEQAPYTDLPALPRSHYATHGHSWRRDFSPRPAQP